ncbi:lipoyl synthase [Mycobacterium tuberculosis]|nr:lipoyl synthase [Mycobacterium tuberculosis]
MSVAAEGRRLLRLEVRNAQTPIERKPPWIKTRARIGPEYTELKNLVRREGLHTVCEEAGCPNIFECWEDREATFLIGGDQCTRRCDFCQIDTGKPAELDRDEPRRVADSVRTMGLRYATVTGVARDDLPDGGAWLYAATVRAIKELNPSTGVELLIPDFNGEPTRLAEVFESGPEVLAHNVETVPVSSSGSGRRSRTGAAWVCLPLRATPAWSPRATSSSAWAKPPTRCAPPWAICATPAATSLPSPNTCGRRRATIRSSAG